MVITYSWIVEGQLGCFPLIEAPEERQMVAPGKTAQRAQPGVTIAKIHFTFRRSRASVASVSVYLGNKSRVHFGTRE